MVEIFTHVIYEGLKSCRLIPRFSEEKLEAWLLAQAIDSLIEAGKNPLHADLNKTMDKIACETYSEAEKGYWHNHSLREIFFVGYEMPLEIAERSVLN